MRKADTRKVKVVRDDALIVAVDNVDGICQLEGNQQSEKKEDR